MVDKKEDRKVSEPANPDKKIINIETFSDNRKKYR